MPGNFYLATLPPFFETIYPAAPHNRHPWKPNSSVYIQARRLCPGTREALFVWRLSPVKSWQSRYESLPSPRWSPVGGSLLRPIRPKPRAGIWGPSRPKGRGGVDSGILGGMILRCPRLLSLGDGFLNIQSVAMMQRRQSYDLTAGMI